MDVKDYGDVSYNIAELDEMPNMKEYAHAASCNLEVSKSVQNVLNDGRICLTLGGDHAIGK